MVDSTDTTQQEIAQAEGVPELLLARVKAQVQNQAASL